MYSTLNKFKIGDCSIVGCGLTDVQGRKVGKNFICVYHYNEEKRKEQISKANQRQRVRGLIKYERSEGILDSQSELTIDLDRVISRYVRLRDMEKDQKITCYTCGKRVPYQKAHAMHFINRQHIGTRFLLQNIKSGCYECNVEKRGNLVVYANRLEKETNGIVEWLTDQSHTVSKPAISELKELLYDFNQKLRLVETKLV